MADQKDNGRGNYDDLIFDWKQFEQYTSSFRPEKKKDQKEETEEILPEAGEEEVPEAGAAEAETPVSEEEQEELPEEEEYYIGGEKIPFVRESILNSTEKISMINLADLLAELRGESPVKEPEAKEPEPSVPVDPEDILQLDSLSSVPGKAAGREAWKKEGEAPFPAGEFGKKAEKQPASVGEFGEEAKKRPASSGEFGEKTEKRPAFAGELWKWAGKKAASPESPGEFSSEIPAEKKKTAEETTGDQEDILDLSSGEPAEQIKRPAKEEKTDPLAFARDFIENRKKAREEKASSSEAAKPKFRNILPEDGVAGILRKLGLTESSGDGDEEDEDDHESAAGRDSFSVEEFRKRRQKKDAEAEVEDILDLSEESGEREPEPVPPGADALRSPEKESEPAAPGTPVRKITEDLSWLEDLDAEEPEESAEEFSQENSAEVSDTVPADLPEADTEEDGEEAEEESGRSHLLYGRDHAPAPKEGERDPQDLIRMLTLGVLAAIGVMCLVVLYGLFVVPSDEEEKAVVETQPLVLVNQENISENIQTDYLTVNPFSRPAISLEAVKGIVIHDSEMPGKSAKEVRDAYEALAQSQSERTSCHYVIGIQGEIIACVPEDEVAYASNSRNMDSISVAYCYADESGAISDAAYQSLVHLCARLCGEHHINGVDIIRHYDINGQNCPKAFVSDENLWTQFRNTVASVVSGEDWQAVSDTTAAETTAAEETGDGTVELTDAEEQAEEEEIP